MTLRRKDNPPRQSAVRCQLSGVDEGLTLIEVIVGIAITSMLVVVFGVSLLAAAYAYRIKLRNLASALADQQLAALQVIDTSTLGTQTNGSMRGVLFDQGTWGAAIDATAPSQPNSYKVATSSATGLTAVAQLPDNAYSDFTLSAKMKVAAGAPAGWRMGMVFRAQDLQSHYQVYLNASSLALKKTLNGVESTLYTDARVIGQDVWETLTITTSGSSLTVSLNGVPVTTQNDTSFSVGRAALAAWEGAEVRFDDVSLGSGSWDFDDLVEDGEPADWARFGLSDLPNGVGTLTIETPYADTSIKRYAATVSWTDRGGGTKSVTHGTLKRN